MSGALPLLPPYAFMWWTGATLLVTSLPLLAIDSGNKPIANYVQRWAEI